MKKKYLIPEIELIRLDNEISLQLSSTEDFNPDIEPDWVKNEMEHPDGYRDNDPYKNNV